MQHVASTTENTSEEVPQGVKTVKISTPVVIDIGFAFHFTVSVQAATPDSLMSDVLDPMERHFQPLNHNDIDSQHDCFDDNGELDCAKFESVSNHEERLVEAERDATMSLTQCESESEEDIEDGCSRQTNDTGSKAGHSSCCRSHHFDDDGTQVFLRPHQTLWCLLHVRNPPALDMNFQRQFRQRFRLPCEEWWKMLPCLKESNLFDCWCRSDAVGNQSSPIELSLLGALRHLGGGLC